MITTRLETGPKINSSQGNDTLQVLREGFTLIEICITLSILAVILGMTIPNVYGWLKQQRLWAPARQLELLARTARLDAIEHQRAYQIVVSGHQISIGPVVPPPDPSTSPTASNPPQAEETATNDYLPPPYTIPDSTSVLVERWDESKFHSSPEWHWIFQPSGLCEPITVKFVQDTADLEIQFDPLTATEAKEKYDIP